MSQSPNFDGFETRSVSTGLALTALILAIVGICVPGLGLIAIILGVVALMKAGSSPHTHGGKGMAIGGIIVGVISLLIWVLAIVVLIPGMRAGRDFARRAVHAAQVSEALKQYAADNKGWYPETSTGWSARLQQYGVESETLQLPAAPPGATDGYVYVPGFKEPFNGSRIVVYENPAYVTSGVVAVIYADSRVDFMDVNDLKKILQNAGRDAGSTTPATP